LNYIADAFVLARRMHPKIDPMKRLSFAKGYLDFDWTKVIFSDEACVYVGPSAKRVSMHACTATVVPCTSFAISYSLIGS
jgi:hypothetical protein